MCGKIFDKLNLRQLTIELHSPNSGFIFLFLEEVADKIVVARSHL